MIKTKHFLSTIESLKSGDTFKFVSEHKPASDSFFVMWTAVNHSTAVTHYGTNVYVNNANDRSSITQELNTKRDAGIQVQISRRYVNCV